MNQSNEQGADSRNTGSAEDMQRANARGENQNEQGQTSFATGSTTGGGSNFGQGSSHLGGESYQQGATTNSGANYNNEEGKLGASSTGTSNEGRSGEQTGAAAAGYDNAGTEPATPRNDDGRERHESRGDAEKPVYPAEGDRRDTELERTSGLGSTEPKTDGRESGSWSRASTDD
jgi:hypothetical protein